MFDEKYIKEYWDKVRQYEQSKKELENNKPELPSKFILNGHNQEKHNCISYICPKIVLSKNSLEKERLGSLYLKISDAGLSNNEYCCVEKDSDLKLTKEAALELADFIYEQFKEKNNMDKSISEENFDKESPFNNGFNSISIKQQFNYDALMRFPGHTVIQNKKCTLETKAYKDVQGNTVFQLKYSDDLGSVLKEARGYSTQECFNNFFTVLN